MKIAILLLFTFILSIYAARPGYDLVSRLQPVFRPGFFGAVEEIKRRAPQEYGITFASNAYVNIWGGKGNGWIPNKRGSHLYWYDILLEDAKGKDHHIRMNVRGVQPWKLESYQIKD